MELFEILNDHAIKVLHSKCRKSGRPSSGHRTGKGQSSSQFPRRVVLKNVLTIGQFHSFPMLVKSCLKSCMLGFSMGFPGGSDDKESAFNVGDLGSIPGLGRSPGGRHGNPFQYSCMENPMDRGAWQATVHRVTKSRT